MIYTPYAVDMSFSHGAKKHRSSSLTIRELLASQGALFVWGNPMTGRRAVVCQVGAHTYGIQIIQQDKSDAWQEVTCFIKSKMTRLDQIKQYLTNTGYGPMQ